MRSPGVCLAPARPRKTPGAATLLMTQGVHPKIVSERLGHSKVSITLDLYSHVTPTLQKEAALALDALIAGREPLE